MLSLILAALLQTAPEAAATAPKDSGLPKDDYRLVAWCHGALAGQLELDPIAKADMEKIEGKAKVAARAKQDAEIEKERRTYLKDYEHALAAAETASPTNIHQQGVEAEVQGYRFWTATRNKEPIWRMLDWGMWDPNDVGCSDAAKRLYNRATLFGEALKGSPQSEAKAEPVVAPLAAEEKPAEAKAEENKAAIEDKPAAAPVSGTEATAGVNAETATAAEAPAATESVKPAAKPSAKTAKTAKAKAKAKPSSAESIREAIAAGKAATAAQPVEAAKDAPIPAPADAKPTDPGLRGPQ